jgi:hypothetical protein
MKDLTYHEGDIMNKQKKELYSFLKKFGWEEDQIAFIDSLPLTDERKKYIFSALPKLQTCSITKEEATNLKPYITEGYFLTLESKHSSFIISTPKTPLTKKDSRNTSLELERLKQIFNKTPVLPIQLNDLISLLNLKEEYLQSIALQYYLISGNKKKTEEYYKVTLPSL